MLTIGIAIADQAMNMYFAISNKSIVNEYRSIGGSFEM